MIALINELQVQDSAGSDDELNNLILSKTAIVCKFTQVPPEILMMFPIEAKKWL
jgi:hypothetical protein